MSVPSMSKRTSFRVIKVPSAECRVPTASVDYHSCWVSSSGLGTRHPALRTRHSYTVPRVRRSSLLVLFLTVFIDLIGFGMVIPFLSFYAREYGASGTMVGAVVGVYSIMQFFFAPIWGRMSDRVGRRPVILISLTASCTGYFLFAFSRSL